LETVLAKMSENEDVDFAHLDLSKYFDEEWPRLNQECLCPMLLGYFGKVTISGH
jgi:hypothetical protein